MEFNEKKFRELVLQIADQPDPNLMESTWRLSKQLFFCDFLAYQETGESLTGAQYLATEQGPTPERLNSILLRMTENEEIDLSKGPYGERVRALRVPTPGVFFTVPEMGLIQDVVERTQDPAAHEVNGLSYWFDGWKAALAEGWANQRPFGIPYETVHAGRQRTPPEQEVEETGEEIEEVREEMTSAIQAITGREETTSTKPEAEKPLRKVSWSRLRGPYYTCDDENGKRILDIHMDLAKSGVWRVSYPNGTSVPDYGINSAIRTAERHLEMTGRQIDWNLEFIKP